MIVSALIGVFAFLFTILMSILPNFGLQDVLDVVGFGFDFHYYFSRLMAFDPFFPISDLWRIFGYAIAWMVMLVGVKIALMAYAFFRGKIEFDV